MTTTPNHILIATGSPTTPKLEIAIYDEEFERASEQAQSIVARLSKAGYHQFSLFETPNNGAHKIVETYRVEQPEPVVICTPKRVITYRDEFPNFDPATMPAIPVGFEDVSWHNDACPSFRNEKAGLVLFVDYADPEMRESTLGNRFSLHTCDEEGACVDNIVYSEDWAEITAAIAERTAS